MWENSTLTNKGVSLQSKILEGRCGLTITKCMTGAGSVAAVNLKTQTAVSSPKQAATLQPFVRKGNEITIPILITNIGLSASYNLWQIGFYAKDPDEGEILYAIAQASSARYIPSESESKGYSLVVNFKFAISSDGAVDITIDPAGLVTMESFVVVADSVDKLWPSQKQIGQIIRIDDAAELPFVEMNVYGKSEQTKTTGKNLFDVTSALANQKRINNVASDYTAYGNGVQVSTNGYEHGRAYMCLPLTAGTYNISADVVNGDVWNFSVKNYNTDTEIINKNSSVDGHISDSFTISEDASVGFCFMSVVEAGPTTMVTNIQLETGDTETEYEVYTYGKPSPSPEYPQQIINTEFEKISIFGKNLFPAISEATANGVTLSPYEDYYVLNGTAEAAYNFSIRIGKLPPGTYTLSANNPKNNSVGQSLCDIYSDVTKQVLAARDDVSNGVYTAKLKYAEDWLARIRVEGGVTYNNFVVKPQLEFGSKATEYEKYKTPQIITAPYTLHGIKVNDGGNYTDKNDIQRVGCVLNLGDGILEKRIGLVDLSTLEWTLVTVESTSWWQTTIDDLKYVSSNTEYGVAIAEQYRIRVASGMSSSASGEFAIDVENIKFNNGSTTDKPSGLLLYALAEPIKTALSSTEIEAYMALTANSPNNTIINDAGADMEVEYVTETYDGALREATEAEIDSIFGGETS